MCEMFKYLTAVAADVIYNAIIDGLFTGRKTRSVKVIGFFNRVETIIPVSEVNISVNWPMHPCLTIFREKECPIEGIKETLNIVECLLQGKRGDILTLTQQILDYSVNLAI